MIEEVKMMDTFPANPFVGLRPFNSDECLLFFGRQEQTAELLQRLQRARLLSVVGSSGCGKSSLIRAGLIPSLKGGALNCERDEWRVAIMKPGDAPLRNLAFAVLEACATPTAGGAPSPAAVKELMENMERGGAPGAIQTLWPTLTQANLLLLVDQFEELFHFGIESNDPDKRNQAAEFVSLLLGLAELHDAQQERPLPIYVVITMRSDYLGECDNFYGLPEALNRSQYLVPRLTLAQRRQAIEGPIRLYGEKIVPHLVDQVLNDVGEQPDQLPVMQHALMRTWDCWRVSGAPALDLPHYEQVGAVKHALDADADRALEDMNEDELRITKLMFQALTNIDARNRLVRRRANIKELMAITGVSRQELAHVIRRFRSDGRSFLVVEDDKVTDDPL